MWSVVNAVLLYRHYRVVDGKFVCITFTFVRWLQYLFLAVDGMVLNISQHRSVCHAVWNILFYSIYFSVGL